MTLTQHTTSYNKSFSGLGFLIQIDFAQSHEEELERRSAHGAGVDLIDYKSTFSVLHSHDEANCKSQSRIKQTPKTMHCTASQTYAKKKKKATTVLNSLVD